MWLFPYVTELFRKSNSETFVKLSLWVHDRDYWTIKKLIKHNGVASFTPTCAAAPFYDSHKQ